MDPFLKLAFEAGQQLAAEELAQKLKAEIKKKESAVGWKENSVAPNRLSSGKK